MGDHITPLVVVRCFSKLWVVFGNRRLYALKEYVRRSNHVVLMKCIVHDYEPRHTQTVESCLFAKFLAAATTMNGGLRAPFGRRGDFERKCPAGASTSNDGSKANA